MGIARIGLREPDEFECAVLSKLMTAEFTGKDVILRQLDDYQVVDINDVEGSVRIRTKLTEKALVKHRVPVDGFLKKSDSNVFEFLLHVIDGRVDELEIVYYGDMPFVRPSLEELESMVVTSLG